MASRYVGMSYSDGVYHKVYVDDPDTEIQTDDITDFDVSDASSGDSLVFDGSDWVAAEALPVDITSPADGDLLSYDSGQWVNAPAPSGSGSGHTHVIKPTDTSKTSDTTMAKDGGFDLAVVSGERWFLEYFFYVGGTGQTGDIKIAPVAPASSTGWWGIDGLVESATSTSASVRRFANATFSTAAATTMATNTTPLFAKLVAFVTIGTTGTLEIWWSQNTSDPTASTIKAASFLRATKVN